MKKLDYKPERTNVKVGSIVIAKPFWGDEVYKRAVILITDKSKYGYVGVIINKASTVSIHEAIPQIDSEQPVYFGGVTGTRLISYIHTYKIIPECEPLGNGLYFGGDPDVFEDMVNNGSVRVNKIRFCAGAVTWGVGQLEEEIKNNQWWVADITKEEVLESEPETLWSFKLLQMGNMYGLFAHIPDPIMN